MEFKDLSPELQEKVKACETPEELLALAKAEGRELTDDELEAISGGWAPFQNPLETLKEIGPSYL